MTNQKPQQYWEKRFNEEFTYTDEEGNRFLLGGYDNERNINTDQIPELKDFISTERTKILDEVKEMVEQLEFSPKGRSESYWYTRSLDVMNDVYCEAIKDVLQALNKLEEESK